jgi:hypothetical protein
LSTRIDYDSTRASVDALMSVAPEFRLDADGALGTLAQVTRSVARWREVAFSHGLQQHDLDMMESAFEHAEARRAWDLIEGRL